MTKYGFDSDSDDDSEVNQTTPSLATVEDDSVNVVQVQQTRGTSHLRAPMDEDESISAYTDNMSASDTIVDQTEMEEEQTHNNNMIHQIVQAGDEAYAMMTEEVLDNYAEDEEEEEAMVLYENDGDEVEEEPVLFPNEVTDEFISPPPQQRLVAPMPNTLPSPSAGICSRLANKCGLNKTSSSNFDYGMRMRRSFRVGWRPDGSFVQLKPSTVGAQVLVQCRPDVAKYEGSKNNTSTSLPLLQTHEKHSVKAVGGGEDDAPIFTLPKRISPGDGSLLDTLEDYANASSVCSFDSSTQKVVSNSFSLLTCLYGGEKSGASAVDDSRRLEAVSTWLKDVVSDDAMQAVSSAQSSGDIYGSIFAALSGGDVGTASTLALESGNPHLSLMLANSSIQAQPYCSSQLGKWHESGAQPFVPTPILRVFSLASGNIDIERSMYKQSGAAYNIDWRRRFGMYLWSCSQQSQGDLVTVSSAINQYGSDISAGLAPPATPMYSSREAKSTDQCILYQVLNQYAGIDTPVSSIVSPPSHSPFFHDFSASFHLGAALTALTGSSLNPHQEDLIVDGVTFQLIGEGFWEWAVYASLCFIGSGTISDSSVIARRLRAKNIISRFYSPSVDPSSGSRSSFLQNIGVPSQWFEEAASSRCASEGDIFGMASNLRCSTIESIAVMEDILIPHMILEGKDSRRKLWQILDALRTKITDDCVDSWNKPYGCGVIHRFLELNVEVEKLSEMTIDQLGASGVDIENLLDDTTDLESMISKAGENSLSCGSLLYAKIPYGFTRTPIIVVIAEVGEMLSLIRMRLVAMKNGQPANELNGDSRKSSKQTFATAPDALFGSSANILRGFCAFKAMD